MGPMKPGKYKVVFRLNSPEAGKFGAPMPSRVIVEEPESKPEPEDEAEIAAELEDVYEQPAEPEPEAFQYQSSLDTLVSMGFGVANAKPVLIAVEGSVERALDILMN